MSTTRGKSFGMEVIAFDHIETVGSVRHAISTRRRWESGRLAEANLSVEQGPGREDGHANRVRLCSALGLEPARLTWGLQVHGDRVAVVGSAGPGAWGAIPDTDGLITAEPGLPLLAFSADCPLVALVDPDLPAVGVVHASWRGTVARMAQKGVEALVEAFGSDPASMLAGIGPSAGPDRYEIGGEVVDAIRSAFGHTEWIVGGGVRPHLDLWAANRDQLVEAGLGDANVAVAGLCTMAETDTFYSHRRDGAESGRFGLMIGLAREN